ncbi:MAG: hypothetical protein ABII72_00490 [Parcubacteria group bacterium]
MNNLLKVGDKLHIIERRYFENDPRRHFIGEVLGVGENSIRAKGYVWIFDGSKNEFTKRPTPRDRVIGLGSRLVINVLPEEVNLDNIKYIDEDGRLVATDGENLHLDINEFSASR